MEFSAYEIPILDWSSNAGSYKSIPIDLDDDRSRDPLVSIKNLGIACESFYGRSDGHNAPYYCQIDGSLADVWCRKLVADKLLEANDLLRSFGVEVYVWDGYRPIETQIGLWSFFWDKSKDAMPNATEDQRRSYVLNYVSDPMQFNRENPTTWPVHTTGGAVDLTLRNLLTKELLDMGASFDEMREISHSDSYERTHQARVVDANLPALGNRRLLHWAMDRVGFVNYPLEFWHFDWGDQMYVHHLNLLGRPAPRAAWYGYVEPPK